MKNVILLYLKTFVIFIGFLGFFYLLIEFVNSGVFGLQQSSFERLVRWALGLTLLVVTSHLLVLKFMGISIFSGVHLGDFQKVRMKTSKSLKQISEILLTHLDSGYLSFNEEKSEIAILYEKSWKSWGEKVIIKKCGQNEMDSEIEIISQPSFKLTVVDYGKTIRM
ncbi:MAG: hypothetical protein IPM92_09620 [Saprospiraceae bacterium]|nr:hypothetical protein [Saprospiraceae bacterium]